MRFWNSRHKVIASLSIQDRIIADSFRLVSGDIDEAGRRNLAASGVSKDMAARIVEMAKTHGQQESVLGHKFWHSQSHKWDDDIRTQFQAVVLQDVNRTIVTPGLGEQPRFMSKTGVRLLGMFRSHALASNTRIVGSGLQRWDASVASGATGMIAIGGMVYALRQWMAGRDISDDPRKWIVEAVDRSGVTGLAMDVNNIMEKITRGKIGVNSALGLGAEVTTRYQSRNMLDAFIGPVMGLAEDIVGVASSPFREGGMTAGDARRIRKMIPYSSIFYWEWLFRTIEEGATSSLSLRGAQ
jgi:hypothetical protein